MKKGFVILTLFVAIAFLVSSCAKIPVPVTPSGTDDTGEGTAEDSDGGTADGKTGSDDAELKQCDEAINYQVLIDALPGTVNGYVAGEPSGNMLTFSDPSTQQVMKYSMASVSLTKDDKSIDVSMTDTCYIQYLTMAWGSYYEMEGTDGFFKKVTIEGFPGWHQYDKSSETYTFNVFAADRVIITVDGDSDVPDSDVEAVVNAIDYSAIKTAAG